jgi:hypothetical protein
LGAFAAEGMKEMASGEREAELNGIEYSDYGLSACGECCEVCVVYSEARQPRCIGCHENLRRGGRRCNIMKCCDGHRVTNCSACSEFPCDTLVHGYNPANPDGPRNALVRIAMTAYRAKHGAEAAARLWRVIPRQPRSEPSFPEEP